MQKAKENKQHNNYLTFKSFQAQRKLLFLNSFLQEASDHGISHEAQILFSSCTVEVENNFLLRENLKYL